MSEDGMTETSSGEINFTDFALRKHRSLWGDAWRRLVSNNTARLGMAIVVEDSYGWINSDSDGEAYSHYYATGNIWRIVSIALGVLVVLGSTSLWIYWLKFRRKTIEIEEYGEDL